jgi:hypothetical protein
MILRDNFQTVPFSDSRYRDGDRLLPGFFQKDPASADYINPMTPGFYHVFPVQPIPCINTGTLCHVTEREVVFS